MLTESSCAAPRHGGVLRGACIALLAGLLCGCNPLYVAQAARGQWSVMHARRPIDAVIADPATAPTLKSTLLELRSAREFAVRELHLPDNGSYRSYANIGRRYVVWNVVAAPEFSVHPRTWCFPVAGCVAYRGYFNERRARAFARSLADRGFDVTLDGVPAYSTLGRFADPVLSTMLPYGEVELVATIFHELAHQRLYVPDDSQFNEAFAVTVEDAGLERWLAARGDSDEIGALRAERERERAYVALFAATRERLERLYASDLPAAQMRARKEEEFAALAGRIRELEHSQGFRAPLYEEWISAGLNNARLASLATYYACVPGFERLLAAADGNLDAFYARARALARESHAARHRALCTP